MDYLDFELEVEAGSGGAYDVSVVRSPAGEAQTQMRLPYDQLAWQNKIQALQIALLRSGGTRRAASTEDLAVQELGTDLFKALFGGDIASRLDVSRTIARREGRGIRIKLRIAAPELLGLPWEYLYDSAGGDYLALGVSTPVVRYMPLAQPIQPLEVAPPLRILAMTAGPRDLGKLDVQRERQRLDVALQRLQKRGLVELEWVPGETWEDLQQALWRGPWHVFHFIGHGGFNKRREMGVVYLTGDDGNSRELSATDLARLLGDHDPLRLALLNSCETAQGTETDIFSSTAAALVRRGTPAVVAMQFEITDEAAIQFSRMFYAATAHGMPVDAAVAEARKSIALQVPNTYEWGTPVLFMRSPDGMLFKIPREELPAAPLLEAIDAVATPAEQTLTTAAPVERAAPQAEPAAAPEPPADTAAVSSPPVEPLPPTQTQPSTDGPLVRPPSVLRGAQVAPALPAQRDVDPAPIAPPQTEQRPPPTLPHGDTRPTATPQTDNNRWPAGHQYTQPAQPTNAAHIPLTGPQPAQQRAPRHGVRWRLVRPVLLGLAALAAVALGGLLLAGQPKQLPDAYISLSSDQGVAGAETEVYGYGFQAGEWVTVSWADGAGETGDLVDAEGSFSAVLTVPVDATAGERTILVRGSGSGLWFDYSYFVTAASDAGEEKVPESSAGLGTEPPFTTEIPTGVPEAVCAFQLQAGEMGRAVQAIDQEMLAGNFDEASHQYELMLNSQLEMRESLAAAQSWDLLADFTSEYEAALDEFVSVMDWYVNNPGDPDARTAGYETGSRLDELHGQLSAFQDQHPELGAPCW